MTDEPTPRLLRVLLVEDNPDDADLVLRELTRGGYETAHQRVETDRDMRLALLRQEWDLVLCDFSMPQFSAPAALGLLRDSRRDIPFLIVSGTIGEETAVEAMRAGADDYLMKGNLARLAPAVNRALREADERRARRSAEEDLQRRDAILAAIGSVADHLLRSRDWRDAVPEILRRLGESTRAGRVSIFERHTDSAESTASLQSEWVAPEVLPRLRNPILQRFSFDAQGLEEWMDRLECGEAAHGSIDDVSERTRQFLQSVDVGSCALVPILVGPTLRAVLSVSDSLASRHSWSPAEIAALKTVADALAAAMHRSELIAELRRSNQDLAYAYDATLEGWSRALDLRDHDTEGHSQRVTRMTVRLARAMEMDEETIVHVRRGALLHDIGKLGVPDGILHKPGPLTEEEWKVMRLHPVYAFEFLSAIPYLKPALDIPHCHHERWDGTGYPRGLAGEDIPLPARIFAVVDVWDALSNDRPYRAALSPEEVWSEIRRETGRHFDPRVAAAFERLQPWGPVLEGADRRHDAAS